LSGIWTSPDAARQFSAPLRCLKCGQKGTAMFEHNAGGHGGKVTATSPFATSDEFYLRMNVRATSNPHIVCAQCGTVHRQSKQ
jgi:hypothetical protein